MGCSVSRAPPRDAEGCVTPHDHEQIQAEDIMLRGSPSNGSNQRTMGGAGLLLVHFSRLAISTAVYRSAPRRWWNALGRALMNGRPTDLSPSFASRQKC